MKIQLAPEDLQQSAQGLDPIRASLYRVCQQQGIAITTMKTFAAGLLLHDQIIPLRKSADRLSVHSLRARPPQCHHCHAGDENRRRGCPRRGLRRSFSRRNGLHIAPSAFSQIQPSRCLCIRNHCLPCPAGRISRRFINTLIWPVWETPCLPLSEHTTPRCLSQPPHASDAAAVKRPAPSVFRFGSGCSRPSASLGSKSWRKGEQRNGTAGLSLLHVCCCPQRVSECCPILMRFL